MSLNEVSYIKDSSGNTYSIEDVSQRSTDDSEFYSIGTFDWSKLSDSPWEPGYIMLGGGLSSSTTGSSGIRSAAGKSAIPPCDAFRLKAPDGMAALIVAYSGSSRNSSNYVASVGAAYTTGTSGMKASNKVVMHRDGNLHYAFCVRGIAEGAEQDFISDDDSMAGVVLELLMRVEERPMRLYSSNDLDDVTSNGRYRIKSTDLPKHSPVEKSMFVDVSSDESLGFTLQVATPYSHGTSGVGQTYSRTLYGETWSPWRVNDPKQEDRKRVWADRMSRRGLCSYQCVSAWYVDGDGEKKSVCVKEGVFNKYDGASRLVDATHFWVPGGNGELPKLFFGPWGVKLEGQLLVSKPNGADGSPAVPAGQPLAYCPNLFRYYGQSDTTTGTAGNADIYRWDGTKWNLVENTSYRACAYNAKTRKYVVGEGASATEVEVETVAASVDATDVVSASTAGGKVFQRRYLTFYCASDLMSGDVLVVKGSTIGMPTPFTPANSSWFSAAIMAKAAYIMTHDMLDEYGRPTIIYNNYDLYGPNIFSCPEGMTPMHSKPYIDATSLGYGVDSARKSDCAWSITAAVARACETIDSSLIKAVPTNGYTENDCQYINAMRSLRMFAGANSMGCGYSVVHVWERGEDMTPDQLKRLAKPGDVIALGKKRYATDVFGHVVMVCGRQNVRRWVPVRPPDVYDGNGNLVSKGKVSYGFTEEFCDYVIAETTGWFSDGNTEQYSAGDEEPEDTEQTETDEEQEGDDAAAALLSEDSSVQSEGWPSHVAKRSSINTMPTGFTSVPVSLAYVDEEGGYEPYDAPKVSTYEEYCGKGGDPAFKRSGGIRSYVRVLLRFWQDNDQPCVSCPEDEGAAPTFAKAYEPCEVRYVEGGESRYVNESGTEGSSSIIDLREAKASNMFAYKAIVSESGTSARTNRFHAYDADGAWISQVFSASVGNGTVEREFEVPDGTAKLVASASKSATVKLYRKLK